MASKNSLIPDSSQKVVPCWDPVMKKYMNCAQQIAATSTTTPGPKATGGPVIQRVCVPPSCCVDYNFFSELSECILNTNQVWDDLSSQFGVCAPTCNGIADGGMTFTQFWRSFTLTPSCAHGWSVLADGTIYNAITDSDLTCYKTGTILTNELAPIPPEGLPQCLELIPQTLDCPAIQICWLLKAVCRGGLCYRYIDNIRYCTQAFPTILTAAEFNNCTNCQGTDPVVVPPPCSIEPINTSLLGLDFNLPFGTPAVISAIEFFMPVCCTDWTVVLDLLTPEFTFNPNPTLAAGITTGNNNIPIQIDITPGTPIGFYIYNIKAFVTCLGSPTVLINVPLRINII